MANGDQQASFSSFASFGKDEDEREVEEEPKGFAGFARLAEIEPPPPEPPPPRPGSVDAAEALEGKDFSDLPGPAEASPPPDSSLSPDVEPGKLRETADQGFLEFAREGLERMAGPLLESAADAPETFRQAASAAGKIASAIGGFATDAATGTIEEAQQEGRELAEAEERGEDVVPTFMGMELFGEAGPTQERLESERRERNRLRTRDSLKGALRGTLPFSAEMGAGGLRLVSALTPDETLLELAGAPEPEALERSADFIIDQEERALEALGEPETGYGTAFEVGTRLALELASFVGAGKGVRGVAGRSQRALLNGGKIASPIAKGIDAIPGLSRGKAIRGLAKLESPTGFAAAVTEDVLSGGVVDYLIGASDERNASATFLHELSKQPEVREGLSARGVEDPEKVTEFLGAVVADDKLRGLFEATLGTVLAVPIVGMLNRRTSRSARRLTSLSDGEPAVPRQREQEAMLEAEDRLEELRRAGIDPDAANRQLPSEAESLREQRARLYEQERTERQQRTRVTLAQLSKGQIDYEDLSREAQRALDSTGGHRFKPEHFERLPDELYHVTTARRSVAEEGLKSRRQLGQERGTGLGGGDDITISFTGDRGTAENIAATMREAQRVASGDITIRDLIRMAEEGEAADRPFAGSTFANHRAETQDYTPGEPLPEAFRQLVEEDRRIRQAGVGFIDQEQAVERFGPGARPAPGAAAVGTAKDKYNRWSVPMSEAEKREYRFELYKRFLAFREEAGGPSNPLFFSSDVEALANTDPADIGIVVARPANPNAKGLKMSALDEWRVYSGDAVEVKNVDELRGATPKRKREQLGELDQEVEVEALPGSVRRVKFADGSEVVTRYEVIDARNLRTSHDPGNFAPRSDYPEGVQERRYHADPAAQQLVTRISSELDPDIVLDATRRATDGPPIITPDGVAVSGNARGMALRRAYELEPERAAAYKEALIDRRSEFGLEASESQLRGMEQPILVRRVTDSEVDLKSRDTLAELASKANDVSTKAREPLAEAATRARRLVENGQALEFYSSRIGPEQTLREFLASSDGREWVRRLNDEGTIPDQELSRIQHDDGTVTDEGKTALERMIFAVAVDDPEVLARAPAGTLRKLTHAVPPMVKAAQVEGFDLGPTVREALDVLHSFRNSDFRTYSEWRSQLSLFDEPQDPRVLDMAEFLNDRNTARIKDAFRGYAADAELAGREATQSTLGFAEPVTPEVAFRRNFTDEATEAADEAARQTGPNLEPFRGMSREQFLGDPTITSDANAAELTPSFYSSARDAPGESFLDGRFELHRGDANAERGFYTVVDGDRAIASYDGDTLVVAPEYRGEGVGTELVYQYRTHHPRFPPADTRTAQAQRIQERVWERIQRELGEDAARQSSSLSRGRADASGTPARASREGEAGGARMTEATSGNEPLGGAQPSDVQTSTLTLRPSDLKRAISPSTTEAGSTVRSALPEGIDSPPRLGDLVEDADGVYRVILQPEDDIDQLLETARGVQDAYRGVLDRAADQVPGVEVYGTRVKERERLAQKLSERPAYANSDYLGGRVWVDDFTSMQDLFSYLGHRGFKLVELDNFLLDPKGGYRGIHVQLEVPGEGGFTAELQIVPREVGEVQEKLHGNLEVVQGRTEVSEQQYNRLKREMEEGFQEQWDTFLDRLGHTEDDVADIIGGERGGAVEVAAGELRVGEAAFQGQQGFANAEVLQELSRVGMGGFMGSAVGSFLGDTPEEKQRNALLGFAAGAGTTTGIRGGIIAARRALAGPPAGPVGEVLARVVKGHDGDTPFQLVQDGVTALREARRRVFDSMHPIERFTAQAREKLGEELPRGHDPSILVRLATGWSEHATEVYERGVVRPGSLERMSEKGLKQIFADLGNRLDDFRAYGIARRVVDDLAPRGIETPIPVEQAQRILDEFEGDEVLEQAFEDYQEYNRAWLELLEEEGILERGGAEAIRNRPDLPEGQSNRSYFPLQRQVDEDVGGAGGSGFANLPQPIKAIRGDTELDILDPLESMVTQTYSRSNLIFRQRVSRALADLAEAWPDNPYMRPVPRPTERIRFGKEQLRGQIADDLFEEIDQPGFEAWIPQRLAKDDPVVRVLGPDGEPQYYELAPEMMDAMLSLNPKQHGWYWKLLAGPARWLRTGVTIMPEFQVRNMIRDLPLAFVTSETREAGVKGLAEVVIDTWRGLGHLLGDALGRDGDELVQLWRTTGGPFAAFQHMDRDALQTHLRQLSREGTVLENVAHPLDALRAMGDRLRGATIAVENAPRLGEFARGLRREFGSVEAGLEAAGRGEATAAALQAGQRSKDLTVDFSRHGASTGALRQMAAFWNARMQGLDKLGRRALEDPKKVAASIAGTITMGSLALYAINRNDPDYWQIPLWERNFFWMVKLPGNPDDVPDIFKQVDESSPLGEALKPMVARGDDMWLRIPKPHELGWLFGSVPERFLEALDPNNPYRSDQVAETLGDIGGELGQLFQSFVPVPTGVLPWLENFFNYDTFLHRPVVPYYEAQTEIDPTLKGREWASRLSRSIADVVGVSPAQVDNVLRDYFGTAGRVGIDVIDELARPPEEGPSPHKKASDRKFLEAFLTDTDRFDAKSISEFYQLQRQAQDKRNSARTWLEKAERRVAARKQLGDPLPDDAMKLSGVKRAQEIWDEHKEVILKRDVLTEVATKLKIYRELRDRIRSSPTLEAEQKEEALSVIARNMAFIASVATFGPEARAELLERGAPTDQERLWAAQLERAEQAADTATVLNVLREE